VVEDADQEREGRNSEGMGHVDEPKHAGGCGGGAGEEVARLREESAKTRTRRERGSNAIMASKAVSNFDSIILAP
jgi:hypothetical protein